MVDGPSVNRICGLTDTITTYPTHIMQVFEAKLNYNLVRLGDEAALTTPKSVVSYMEGAFDEDPTVEWFFVILLNIKCRPLGRAMVTKGTATASLVHPREVFKPAILAGAASIICIHNHPSGDPVPSSADISVTQVIRESAKILGIDVIDHIIIGNGDDDPMGLGYYSFSDAGFI